MSYATHLVLLKATRSLGSIADFLLLYALLKLVDLLREHHQLDPHRRLYYYLYASFGLTQLMFLACDYVQFFLVEVLVLNIQVTIGAWALVKNFGLVVGVLNPQSVRKVA